MSAHKTSKISSALANASLAGGLVLAQGAHAAMPANAILHFDDGVNSCQAGGTYPNCQYDATTVTPGSYFTMDLDSDNNPDQNERTALLRGPDQGIHLGTIQSATGSHTGVPNGNENPGIDQAWGFAGNTGMHLTTTAPTILSDDGAGNVTLNLSGWVVTWNGIDEIPMDSRAWHGTNADGEAVVTCNVDCSAGDTFVLDYSARVPDGDPSGFGNVGYTLHMEGTIKVPQDPDPSAGALAAGDHGGDAASDYRVSVDDLDNQGIAMDPDYDRISDIFDFSITGVGAGGTVDVVLQLYAPLDVDNAEYRKYTGSWGSFRTSGSELVKSAQSVAGSCPVPSDPAYDDGLNQGDDCIQLSLQDGGFNDADGDGANGEIVDPGFIGVPTTATTSVAAETGSSGCSLRTTSGSRFVGMDWLLIAVFLTATRFYLHRGRTG